jgi:hypothetical protein
MKSTYFFFIIPLMMFFYCASGHYKLTPEYQDANFNKSILGIILLKDGIQILNPDDFTMDSVNNNVESLYCNYFSSDFLKILKTESYFKNVYLITDFNKKELISMNVEFNKEHIISILNPSNKSFYADSFNVLLILNNILVQNALRTENHYISNPNPRSTGVLVTKSNSNYLTHWGTYAFYDNINGKLISFGEFDDEINVEFGISNETLRKIIRKSAMSICNQSNFKKY